MKIVFLDAKTIGDDIDLSGFDALGEVTRYDFTTPEEAPERVKDADVLIINKVPVNEQTIHTAAHLKLVCVTATGTNNLDKDYLASRGIAWRNVAGYSTETVTQHTFAMLFYLLEKLRYYDDYVKNGNYINDTCFTHFSEHFSELNGKTWGIIGLGAIGRRVAQIAEAFGAHVIYYSASGQPTQNGYTQVDFDTLLTTSDIISVHAPLNEYTENLLDKDAFAKMKKSCIFLNLGRGPIVVEQDLYDALITDEIAAAGLDVLCQEPMSEQNPLFQIKDSRKLLITPHIAWAGIEARIRLMDIILNQIKDFLNCNHSVLPGGLKVLGTLLTEASQNSVVCRLGGDEFLLFIPEIQYASISAGLYLSTKGEPFEDCYSKADKALYHVKQNGKQGFFFYQQMELDFSENEVTGKDLELIAHALSESGRYNGDLNLDYRELCMEQPFMKKIRKVDICTRYSSMQYLLILYEPDETQISKVMDRIFQYYDTLYDKKDFKPSYEYRPIQHSNN